MNEQAKKARREYMKKWREKNREHYNSYMRSWKSKPGNKERVKQHKENYWNKKAAELERGEKIASGS